MRITAEVKLIDHTDEAIRAIERETSDALQDAAAALLAQIKGQTPVRSGALRASEHIEAPDPFTREIVIGGRGVNYAAQVERRRSFATKTADSFQPRFENTVATALKRLLGGK